MNNKTSTIIVLTVFLVAGLAVVPGAYCYSSETDNCGIGVGVKIFDNTIYDPADGADRANTSVKNAIDNANENGITGTIDKGAAKFIVVKNPQNGIQDPKNAGKYYPSAYIGVSTDKSKEPSIAGSNDAFSVSFDMPAGQQFGIRIKASSGNAHVSVSCCTGQKEYSPSAGIFFGDDGTGKLTKDKDNILWIHSDDKVTVTINGQTKLLTSYIQVQVYMMPSY